MIEKGKFLREDPVAVATEKNSNIFCDFCREGLFPNLKQNCKLF